MTRKLGLFVKEPKRKTPFRELDHTADLRVEICGKDEQDLYRNAAESLYLLLGLPAVSGRRDDPPSEILEIHSRDPEEALVELLGELLYRATVERTRVSVHEISVRAGGAETGGSTVVVSGVWVPLTAGEMAGLREIKAVTYHDVRIRRIRGGLAARVVMDL